MNRMRASSRRLVAPTVLFVAFIVSMMASGSAAQEPTISFAAIGDYGADSGNHTAVADMIGGWNPDFIITVGDNRYDVADYDPVVGRRYCDYMLGVKPGQNCGGGNSASNRFFPALGNHDYNDGNGIGDYLDYFSLPGNERNYDYVQGPVHFFVVDSGRWGSVEPDQAEWLRTGLQASTSEWQIVYFHHAAYSSADHGSNQNMQLDYAGWGADAVLAGHDHHYERIERDGIVYFVNGLGGKSIYGIGSPVAGSRARYNSGYGAMRITASASELHFEFRAIDGGDGQVIDSHTLYQDGQPPTSTTTPTGSGSVEVRVGARGDDVEQILIDGSLYTDSSDLELVDDNYYRGEQAVGLRFRGLDIPPGATVTRAYVRFVADESDAATTNLVFTGHDVGQTWTFAGTEAVTGRTGTDATVDWGDVAPWTQGTTYESPDLRTVIQEIVGRSDWQSGNDLALLVSGHGERTAESFDGSPAQAPLLRVEYSTGSGTTTTTTPGPTTTGHTTTGSTTSSAPSTTSTVPSGGGVLDIRVSTGGDDVEEGVADGALYRDSSDIELVDDTYYKGLQVVGLRFRSVEIPVGAVVTNAYVSFKADESDSVATNLTIRGNDTGDAPPFGSGSAGVAARQLTGSVVRWNAVVPWTEGLTYRTPGLEPVLQEIVDRGDWAAGNDVVLTFAGSGERTAESYEGSPNAAPLLHVEYRLDDDPGPTTTVPATTTPPTTTVPTTTTVSTTTTIQSTTTTRPAPSSVDVRINRGVDDVEEGLTDGALYTNSSDIELIDDSYYKGLQMVGLRFQNVAVPQGATITAARIRLTADEADSRATNLVIVGHDVADAPGFNGAGAVSSRTGTAATTSWNGVQPWTVGQTYDSPDLRAIVQEIVDRGDWRAGNALAFMISGAGERTAESYDGSPSRAPLLHIEFTEG